MAEGPALEKRYPGKTGIVGSNPTLSAIFLLPNDRFQIKQRISYEYLYCGEMTERLKVHAWKACVS